MSVRELPLAEIYPSGPEADAPGATAHPGENTRALALLLGAALALMLVWTAIVPFDKGPDEAEHYRVAHFIYANGRLPVFAADGDMYGYVVNAEEAFISYAALPGFNYVLSALAMRLVLTDDPYALLYAARFVSTLAVLMTIYLAYRTARLLFPKRPDIARGTALLLVLIPQVTLTGAYVNQDAYTMAVCSWTVYLLLAGWKEGWTAGRAAWLGVALGLVLLGRLNGYVVIPFALLVAALSLRGGVGFVLITDVHHGLGGYARFRLVVRAQLLADRRSDWHPSGYGSLARARAAAPSPTRDRCVFLRHSAGRYPLLSLPHFLGRVWATGSLLSLALLRASRPAYPRRWGRSSVGSGAVVCRSETFACVV